MIKVAEEKTMGGILLESKTQSKPQVLERNSISLYEAHLIIRLGSYLPSSPTEVGQADLEFNFEHYNTNPISYSKLYIRSIKS